MARPKPPPLLPQIAPWLARQEYGELGYFEVDLDTLDDSGTAAPP